MGIDKDKDSLDEIFLSDDFEVRYEGDLSEVQADIKDDAYKDVLSALSELDDTQSFDYLEMNKTRTLNLEEDMQNQEEQEETNPLKKIWYNVFKL